MSEFKVTFRIEGKEAKTTLQQTEDQLNKTGQAGKKAGNEIKTAFEQAAEAEKKLRTGALQSIQQVEEAARQFSQAMRESATPEDRARYAALAKQADELRTSMVQAGQQTQTAFQQAATAEKQLMAGAIVSIDQAEEAVQTFKRAMSTAVTPEDRVRFAALGLEASKLRMQMAGVTPQMGRTGNAARSMGYLFNDTQQFAFGLRAGLISISNNLPMVADDLFGGANAAGKLARAIPYVGLAISALSTIAVLFGDDIAAAFGIGKQEAKELEDYLKGVRREMEELLLGIERLSGSDLFARKAQGKSQLFEVEAQMKRIAELSEKIRLDKSGAKEYEVITNLATGEKESLSRAEAMVRLNEQWVELDKERLYIQDDISRIEIEARGNIAYRAAKLREEIDLLVGQGVETEELIEKRIELEQLEARMAALRGEDNSEQESEKRNRELEEARESALARRELEIELMAEGREKQLASIGLYYDQQIETYRQKWGEAAPGLFLDFQQRLLEQKDGMMRAAGSDLMRFGSRYNPNTDLESSRSSAEGDSTIRGPVQMPVELLDDAAERQKAIKDAVNETDVAFVAMDGSINAVMHNLQALQEMYDAATTDGERSVIAAKIEELEALEKKLKGTKDAWRETFNEFVNAATQVQGLLQGVFDNHHASRLNQIASERDAQLQGIDAALKAAGTSESERQRLLEQRAIVEERFREKEQKARRKQAESEKKMALFQIAIETAKNVVKAFPDVGKMILAGVIGAAQAAVVAGQPIPQFAKGVDGFGGGVAEVGERGSELVVLPPMSNVLTNENTRRLSAVMGMISRAPMSGAGANMQSLERAVARAVAAGLDGVEFRQRGYDLVGNIQRTTRLDEIAGAY